MVKFGKYDIINNVPIKGGSKEVFKGFDPDLGIDVAIKVLRDIEVGRLLRKGKTQLDLHRREPQILAKLNHPNVVRVFDAGIIEEKPCIIEEWVGGGTLEERIGNLTSTQVIDIGIQLTQALNYVYSQLQQDGKPFLHRDLKPANVYFTEEGQVKLGDFALATSKGEVPPGSVYYLSPEQLPQLLGEEVESDERHEVFSLGVLLYQSLTGELPHIDNKFKEFTKGSDSLTHKENVLEQIKTEWDPHPRRINPSVPRRLDSLVVRMLSKNIEDRPNMREAQKELESLKWWQNNFGKVVKGIASATVVIIASGAIIYEMYKPLPPAPLTDRVLIVSAQEGDAEIYGCDMETQHMVKLTDNDVNDKNIVPHPLGKRFTFETMNGLDKDIMEMNVNGLELRRVATTKYKDEYEFSYSDDGNKGIYITLYDFVKSEIIIVNRGEDGEWTPRPPSFTGTKINKARLFMDNTVLFLQEGDLKIAKEDPSNDNDIVAEECTDFEVRGNSIYYIQGGKLYVRHLSPGETQIEFFNSPIKGSMEEIHQLYSDLPQETTLTLTQDKKSMIVQDLKRVRIMNFEDKKQMDSGNPQNTFTYQDYHNGEIFALIKDEGDTVCGIFSIIEGDNREPKQFSLTKVLQIANCSIAGDKK